MKIYNEIITKSLIDFEEIKLILANNNVELVKSEQIKERYFLKKEISFKTASYKTILDNSYVLLEKDEKVYLNYKTYNELEKCSSSIEIVDENECIDFLNHIGFKETFNIEKNVYLFSNENNQFSVINLINTGIYLSAEKENASKEELMDILNSFKLPYKEDECNESIEKLVISKVRRYLR